MAGACPLDQPKFRCLPLICSPHCSHRCHTPNCGDVLPIERMQGILNQWTPPVCGPLVNLPHTLVPVRPKRTYELYEKFIAEEAVGKLHLACGLNRRSSQLTVVGPGQMLKGVTGCRTDYPHEIRHSAIDRFHRRLNDSGNHMGNSASVICYFHSELHPKWPSVAAHQVVHSH